MLIKIACLIAADKICASATLRTNVIVTFRRHEGCNLYFDSDSKGQKHLFSLEDTTRDRESRSWEGGLAPASR